MKKLLKWTYQHWKLSDLKPHPGNSIFGDRTEAEIQELADDMAARGQQHPIDVLAGGTIVGGHQRRLAAKLLGWDTIHCRVRYDLERAGEGAIEEYLLRDNFNQRQLSPLESARIFRRLKVLAKKNGRRIKGDLRDFIAKRLGKSGRTLDRWAHLLDASIEVQNAVTTGKLKLLDGCRVVSLPAEVQANIARKIKEGKDPHLVVQGYVGNKNMLPDNVGTVLSRFLRGLGANIKPLRDRVDEIKGEQWSASLPSLQEAQQLIQRLTDRIRLIADSSEHGDILRKLQAKGGKK